MWNWSCSHDENFSLEFLSLFLRALRGRNGIMALCPSVCVCDFDECGRKRVRCEQGGVRIPGTLDIQNLDNDVEVLVVSGSPENPNIINLEPSMFLNKRFKEIHLTHSDLERMSSSPFHYVSNTLQVLNLTHNRLSFAVEQNFRNLTRLTHLHLDYNRIEPVFSAMFNFLSSLKVLTMSHNLIREIPPRMALKLASLEVLDLSSNPLGERQPDALNDNRQPIPDTIFQDFQFAGAASGQHQFKRTAVVGHCSIRSIFPGSRPIWQSITRNPCQPTIAESTPPGRQSRRQPPDTHRAPRV
ncbi:chondroadherin-like [Paramacrobiotus metropolitanus]|uniref:chondroadherin-like n=1 Tax=Paramacrobiotus metropolitanus TaxID=2943436 RepID=UPI0024455EA8|nr:chondroadherin-like [Paramacrobiotus metropolitanus]